MPEHEVIQATQELPATVRSIHNDLDALGVVRGSVLIVHASLSSLGWVCGGAAAVADALQAVVGSSGTIVMPTHSADLSEPSLWSNPPVPSSWWPVIRESMPAFRPLITPTRGLGVIAECFRTRPGVLRSSHPHVSFSAAGPHAEIITSGHALDDGLGNTSPLGRLYDLRATVLLLGVGHERNTSLHLSEIRADDGRTPMTATAAPLLIDGQRQWIEFPEPELDAELFPQIGRAFANGMSLVRCGRVGMCSAMLMPQQELVDFGVEWLKAHRK